MAAPELRLSVGLDLAFLRQQLSTIGTELGGQPLNIAIKLDRTKIASEYRLLQRYFGNKTFRASVQTNLQAELEYANKLVEALERVKRTAASAKTAIPIGTRPLSKTKSQGGLDAAEVKRLYEALAMAGVEGFEAGTKKNRSQMVAQMGAVSRDVIAGLLNGLKSKDPQVQKAAQSLGQALIASTKRTLGIASPSKEFEEIGKDVGRGFEKGVLSSMDAAFNALEGKMRQRVRVLDTFARGVFRMLGMDPVQLATERRQTLQSATKTIQTAQEGGRPAGVAGLLPSSTARGNARRAAQAFMGGYGMPDAEEGPGGKLALSSRALQERINRILAGHFRVIEATIREDAGGAELRRALNVFGYVAQALRDAEQRAKQARIEQAIDKTLKALDDAIAFRAKQARRQIDAERIRGVGVRDLGATPQAALLGASFAEQKRLVGDILSPSLKEALRGAANAFVDSIRAELNAAVRSVNVRDLGTSMQAALSGRQIAGLLPSATGMSVQDRIAQAYQRSAARGLSVMAEGIGGGGPPRLPPGVGRIPAPYGGGPGRPSAFGGGIGRAQGQLNRFIGNLSPLQQARLPLTGAVEELTSEFAQATKQVLLYGAAYKGLAFIMNLPGQALKAATALQSFRNQLDAVTGGAAGMEQSLQFLDGLAGRFALPLTSLRDGFTRIYASMAPVGFSAEEIQNLFTGVSKAAATLGMSADKVDRVTYALGQMASKGQITAEELRGQLGDVLPGALSLFARAANMDIPQFSKAMEDGAFKGDAMRQVLNNVAILLNRDFGKGATGAAKTLRGSLALMQNDLLKMYEALEPLVNQVVATFGPQMRSLILGTTDAFKVLSGNVIDSEAAVSALSPAGRLLYTIVESIKPSLVQAGEALRQIGQTALQATPFIASTAAALLSFIASDFGRRVITASLAIGALTSSFTILRVTGITPTIRAIYLFIAAIAAGPIREFQLAVFGAARGLVGLQRAAVGARIAAIALRTAITGVAVGAVLIFLDALGEKLLNLGNNADASRGKLLSFRQELDQLAASGMTEDVAKKYMEANTELAAARKQYDKLLQESAARRLLGPAFEDVGPGGAALGPSPVEMAKKLEEAQRRVLDAQSKLNAARTSRDTAAAKALDNQKQQQQELQKVELQGDDKAEKARQKELDDAEKLAERRRRDAEEFARQEGQRITASAEFRNERERLSYELAKELAESNLDHQKAMIDARFDYELAGMDGLHAKHKRNAKELLEIELRGIKRVADAETAMTNAALKVKAAQAMRQAKQQAAQLLPQEQAVGGGSSGGRMQGYLRRLSFLETGIRNVPNAQGSGAMGFFQTKGPFHGEALTASGGMNSRSGNYSEAAGAVEAWIKKHRPKAYDAILAGNFDAADAILSQGTWPSLPGGSQARPPEVQRQARQFLTPPAAPLLPAASRAGAFDTGMRTGPSSVIGGSAAYHQDIMFGSTVTMRERVQLMDQLATEYEKLGRVIEFSNAAVADERYTTSLSYAQKESLISRAQAAHAARGRPAMDYYAPLVGQTRAGKSVVNQAMLAPVVPGASYAFGGGGRSGRAMTVRRNGRLVYEMLHGRMDRPVPQGGVFTGSAAPVSGARNTVVNAAQEAEYSVEIAQIEQANEAMRQLQIAIKGTALDSEELKARLRENLAEAFPVEQLQLEQSLLKQRNQLLLEGAPEEYIQAREQITRSEQDAALMAAQYESKIDELSTTEAYYLARVKEGGANQARHKVELQGVRDRLAAYREQLEKLTPEQARYNAEVLTSAVNALKNADALKAVEEATAMVNSAVEGVVSSYKDLFVDIMSGGDIKEAAKKMQESLSKQVFTMFIDFSMKPVEKFFKDQLLSIFGLPNEESKRAEVIAQMERQIAALDRNTAALQGTPAGASGQAFGGNASLPSPLMGNVLNAPAFEMSGKAMQEASEQAWQFPDSLGGMGQAMEQFNANTSAVTSSLVGEARKGATATTTWQENLGRTVSAVGIAASSIVGITAGISQIKEGGVSGVLGGIGSIAMSLGSALGGFSAMGLFGGGGSGGVSVPKLGMFTAANGAVWKGGFQAFANGGVVNGPTLGLVGEGRYNEAIVPLPDGRSIPVKMAGGQSAREAMSNGGMPSYAPSMVSFSFESTKINGVEYVSRDQLELAMASTRREAIKEGAKRGMGMTLDKIQQSPGTRRSIAMGRR